MCVWPCVGTTERHPTMSRECGAWWGVSLIGAAAIAAAVVTYTVVIAVYWTAQELYDRRVR